MRASGPFSTYLRAKARSTAVAPMSVLDGLAANEIFLVYLLCRWSEVVPLDVDVSSVPRKGAPFVGHSYKESRRTAGLMMR